MKRNLDYMELLRYLMSGTAGFVLYYVFALGLRHWVGLPQSAAAFIGTIMAIPPTFLMQRNFTFRVSSGGSRQVANYLSLQLFVACMIALSAHVMAKLKTPDFAAFLVAGLIGVSMSYIVQKKLVFVKDAKP